MAVGVLYGIQVAGRGWRGEEAEEEGGGGMRLLPH